MSWRALRPGTIEKHAHPAALEAAVEGELLSVQQILQSGEPLLLDGLRHLIAVLGGGGAGTGRIFERISLGKTGFPHDIERFFEIRVGFARKTDDKVGRKRQIRPRFPQALDDPPILIPPMPPVHRRENPVRAALHRKMQERHQARDIAMGGDELVIDIERMGRRVAQPLKPLDPIEPGQKPAQAPALAVRALAVIGVDVLAQAA